MTVVRHLPEQLILAQAPWLLGAGLILCILCCVAAGIGLVFAGEPSGWAAILFGGALPGSIFAMSVQRDQAIFDAEANHIILQRRTLLRYRRQEFPLGCLECAELQEIAETARPVILINGKQYPLVDAYKSGNAPRRIVKVINDWHWNARRLRRK